MIRKDLERRIRILEKGIDQFEGMEWIVKVGEIAEIKAALFEMPDQAAKMFGSRITPVDLTHLDSEIALCLDEKPAALERQKAFRAACATLRRWLEPSFPGLHPAKKPLREN